MRCLVSEEIQKIERDLVEVKRLGTEYKAPITKAQKYLEGLVVEKYNLLSKI